jgi:cell volume regulation protein A
VHDISVFGLIILGTAAAMTVALLSNRLTERSRVPAPLIFFASAAIAAHFSNRLAHIPMTVVQRIVTVALIAILFEGGMKIGARRCRSVAGPVLALGVVGTFATAGAVGAVAHYLFAIGWLPSLLLGTALAPTDPAVVFSVLGQREFAGRSGVLLEAESGANDPVGIALMASLLGAPATGFGSVVGSTAGEFALEMAVGAVLGVISGRLLLLAMRRLALPSAGLYPLRTFAGGLAIYGLTTVAHGSGFLAVLLAGIVIGDERAPYKGDIRRFHASLASLGEIAAFIVLGLTVDVGALGEGHAWLIGLVLGALLAVVIRPLVVGPMLMAVDMSNGERALVAWAGLKGAVPILLGTYVVTAHVHDAARLYAVIIVVVTFSVFAQGSLVPFVARLGSVRMTAVTPEPWTLGVRLSDEPQNLRRYQVQTGSRSDGARINDLDFGTEVWVSFILRAGSLMHVSGETKLQPGDEVVLLVDSEAKDPRDVFETTPRLR